MLALIGSRMSPLAKEIQSAIPKIAITPRGNAIPVAIFDPVVRLLLCIFGVWEGTTEPEFGDVDLAVQVGVEDEILAPVVAAFPIPFRSVMRLIISQSVACHRTWMTSASTIAVLWVALVRDAWLVM